MQEIRGLLDSVKQHDKLAINVSSNANSNLPVDLLTKFLQPHKINHYFFSFVEEGASTYKVDLEEITIADGQLLFVLPNQILTPPAQKGAREYFKLVFDEKTLALLPHPFPFLVNPLYSKIITFTGIARQRVKIVFEMLTQLMYSEGEKDTEIVLAHLNTLLTEFNSAYFKTESHDNVSNPKLSKYVAFKMAVESHLTEQQSINTIAEELALTTSGLYGIVKEFSGVSPKEFIINRLMLEAQRKLHYSKLSVKELAYDLGFNDPDYFSRLFKKSTGKSVSQFLADS